ncbi:hypothetical protein P378_01715 [Desulforamulus profundi]|uniref:YetF C-terminal domain-containing protein n=1 Tax=Desulforamulus profundi TaxID=1383067 RepID=A0A2C6MEG7_9FIRM|nr:hypothetical protein P378_01715 [Desulforamulus profundi]
MTTGDIGVTTQYEGVASELIVDGKLIQQNLQQNNLSKEWLITQLQKQGIKSIEEVSFASLDTSGNLYVDKYHDNLQYVEDITDEEK